jgi:hypothetical protein
MAKRKAAGAAAKKKGATRRAGQPRAAAKRTAKGSRKAKGARKASASARKTAGRKAGRKAAKPPARKSAKKTAARKTAARKTGGRKTARQGSAQGARGRSSPAAARKTSQARAARALPARKAPDLNRDRRTVGDEDLVQSTPPSSFDLDRSASAVRTGRRNLRDRFNEHTETSPAMTGGDVDADWESAYSVGDEAPGGDNPTPDQDIVDDIGRAVGVEYQDNEELKGADKLSQRDRHRWELDPASSEDWDER